MCGTTLARADALFCPKGHKQADDSRQKGSSSKGNPKSQKPKKKSAIESDSDDSESNDRDPSDTENARIVSISANDWLPNKRSLSRAQETLCAMINQTRQGGHIQEASNSASTSALADHLTAELKPGVDTLCKKTRRTDAEDQNDKRKGAWGMRPGNDKLVKCTINVWLVEQPPVKPQNVGHPHYTRLDLDVDLDSLEKIHNQVIDQAKKARGYSDHQGIASRELVIDTSRKAYIGRVENDSVPGLIDLSIYNKPQVATLFVEFKEKMVIHLCVPVKRPANEPSEFNDDSDENSIQRLSTIGKQYLAVEKSRGFKRQRSNTRKDKSKSKRKEPIAFNSDRTFLLKERKSLLCSTVRELLLSKERKGQPLHLLLLLRRNICSCF